MHLLDGIEIVSPYLSVVVFSNDKGLMMPDEFLAVLGLSGLDILYVDLLLLLRGMFLWVLLPGVDCSHWLHPIFILLISRLLNL